MFRSTILAAATLTLLCATGASAAARSMGPFPVAPSAASRVVGIAVDVSPRDISKRGYDDTNGPQQRWDAVVDTIEEWLLDESVSGDLETRDLSLVVSNYAHDAVVSDWNADVSTAADVEVFVRRLADMSLAEPATYGRYEFASQIDAGLDALAPALRTVPQEQQRACVIHDWDLPVVAPSAAGPAGQLEAVAQETDGVTWSDYTGSRFADAADGVGDLAERLSILWTVGDYYDDEEREQDQRDYFRYTHAGLTRGAAGTQAEYAGQDELTADHGRLCFSDAVDVDGLEITQGTQDPHNTVPLVAGRDTIARAFVREHDATTATDVDVRLHGAHRGEEHGDGPLTVAGTDPATRPVSSSYDPFAFRDLIQGERSPMSFEIPRTWSDRVGGTELELSASRPIAECGASLERTVDGRCALDVAFGAATKAKLVILQAKYVDDELRGRQPSLADSEELARRVARALPFGEITTRIYQPTGLTTFGDAPTSRELGAVLGALGTNSSPRPATSPYPELRLATDRSRLIIVVHAGGRPPAGDATTPGWTGGSRFGDPERGALIAMYDRDAVGLEQIDEHRDDVALLVGRTLGLQHPTQPARSASATAGRSGVCGERVAEPFTDIGQLFESVDGTVRPTLGPLGDGRDREVFGLDVDLARAAFDGTLGGDGEELAIASPQETWAVMSLCAPMRWPSSAEYAAMRAAIG